MNISFNTLWKKSINYIKENKGVCMLFAFIFFVGLAAGITMVTTFYNELAQKELAYIPGFIHNSNLPWGIFAAISLSGNLLLVSMLFLSGITLFTSFLWIAAILLRGIICGAGIGAAFCAWPSPIAVVILLLLWAEAAFLLFSMMRMCIVSAKEIRKRLNLKLHKSCNREFETTYAFSFLKAIVTLLPCMIIEVFIMPIAIYALC